MTNLVKPNHGYLIYFVLHPQMDTSNLCIMTDQEQAHQLVDGLRECIKQWNLFLTGTLAKVRTAYQQAHPFPVRPFVDVELPSDVFYEQVKERDRAFLLATEDWHLHLKLDLNSVIQQEWEYPVVIPKELHSKIAQYLDHNFKTSMEVKCEEIILV